jgi:signal transduction histidine kinase
MDIISYYIIPYYISLIILTVIAICVYIIRRLLNKPSLTNQLFIASLVFDILEDPIVGIDTRGNQKFANKQATLYLQKFQPLSNSHDALKTKKIIDKNKKITGYIVMLQSALNKKEYENQIQNKIKEIDYRNNIIEQIKQNLEKEKKITQQKLQDSTRDLKEDYNRLLSSINNLNFGFIITDKEKNIILINKNLKTDIKLQENIQLLQNIDEVLKTGKALSVENIQINNNYANIFISPIFPSHSPLEGWLAKPDGVDNPPFIKTQNNTPQVIGTSILIEDKTGNKFLEQSEERFIALASHELRTPLTAIKGYLSLIKKLHYTNIKDEKLKKIINDLDTSCARLINIVNDFLDKSKLEQGEISFHPEESNLVAIINTSIRETESIATQKKLSIKLETSEENAKVFADAEKIKQIAINLISNAIKYTDRGGITLNIQKTPDKYYKVTIKDTGKGIPQENIKSLFTKYQQHDPNKPVKAISSGLGLYISKLLIEKMNGKIQLDNTENEKGSTFSFSLPVYEYKNVPPKLF